jgi:abortive infection bacteriophage resistance protein
MTLTIPATPLNNADQGGLFFMSEKVIFDKPALSIEDQISLLKQRKLIIGDTNSVNLYLTTIGYYRLMIYFKPFLINPYNSEYGFKPNTSFADILQLYIFDRELRLLVTDAIERIEVTFRTAISNTMSIKYGSHWYLDCNLFSRIDLHKKFLEEISIHLKRSHEDFIKSYYNKYQLPEHPPSWMVIECISFGTISKIFSIIKDRAARKQVGDVLGQFSEIIKSWMKALTYTRNLCAHHSRLWNRFFVNRPQVDIKILSCENNSPFYLQAYIICQLLKKISPDNHWKKKLYSHFELNSKIDFSEMGFISDWKNDNFWD